MAARKLKIAILGMGKAGGSLRASAAGRVSVVEALRRLPQLLRPRSDWLSAGVLFIAVPDDALDDVVAGLATQARLPRLVAHLSGTRGADALQVLRERHGVDVGTFHPLASLDGRAPIPERTFIAIEGSPRARRVLGALARKLRLRPGVVHDADRVRYHAGAVVAGNLAIALVHEGVQLLVDSGVPADVARESLARLLASSAHNAVARPLAQALTGPVARGDVATLERHLALLDRERPALAQLYRTLSRLLVDDVVAQPAARKRAMARALR